MAQKLTKRRLSILKLFYDYQARYSRPPALREINDEVGLHSTGATYYQITTLLEMGYLERSGEGARGLRITEAGIEALKENGLIEGGTREYRGNLSDTIEVPILGFIRAGEPIPGPGSGAVSENPFGGETIPVQASLIRNPDRLFALVVKGDSMVDASVHDGDYVILKAQNTAEAGDMVAAWIVDEESTTLKYIYPHMEKREIELRPANPAYRPIFKPVDKVRVDGKVVAVIRSLEKHH